MNDKEIKEKIEFIIELLTRLQRYNLEFAAKDHAQAKKYKDTEPRRWLAWENQANLYEAKDRAYAHAINLIKQEFDL